MHWFSPAAFAIFSAIIYYRVLDVRGSTSIVVYKTADVPLTHWQFCFYALLQIQEEPAAFMASPSHYCSSITFKIKINETRR